MHGLRRLIVGRRFLIDQPLPSSGSVEIVGDLFRHMVSVLRIEEGEEVLLADGSGAGARGRVGRVDTGRLFVHIVEQLPPPPPSIPRITLLQGLPKGEKMEFVLQKCTELGVDAIAPFLSSRCVARPSADRLQEKSRRWTRIVREAARQSHSPVAPQVADLLPFHQAVMAEAELKLLLWEEEQGVRLREVLDHDPVPARVAVMIGPEGGISADEAELAVRHGFIPVSLGERILRTETAGVAVLSILKFWWGHLG